LFDPKDEGTMTLWLLPQWHSITSAGGWKLQAYSSTTADITCTLCNP